MIARHRWWAGLFVVIATAVTGGLLTTLGSGRAAHEDLARESATNTSRPHPELTASRSPRSSLETEGPVVSEIVSTLPGDVESWEELAHEEDASSMLARAEEILRESDDPLSAYSGICDLISGVPRARMVNEKDLLLQVLMHLPFKLVKELGDHPEYWEVIRTDMTTDSSESVRSLALAMVQQGIRSGHVDGVAPEVWVAYQASSNHTVHRDIVRNLHTWGQDSTLVDLAFEEAIFSTLDRSMPEVWEDELGGQRLRLYRKEILLPNYPGLQIAVQGCEAYLRKYPDDAAAVQRLHDHLLTIGRDPNLDPRELELLFSASDSAPGLIENLVALMPQYQNPDTSNLFRVLRSEQ